MKLSYILVMTLLLISCSEQGTNESAQFSRINFDKISVIDLALIKKQTLFPKCLGCHSWVNDDSEIMKRVTKGDPENSSLYLRTNDGSMPFGGPPLIKDEVTLIYKFIKGFALNAPKVDDPSVVTQPAISLNDIRENILNKKCIFCHSWMNSDEEISKRLVSGHPEESPLYMRTLDGSMPLSGQRLSEAELNQIYQFILNTGSK